MSTCTVPAIEDLTIIIHTSNLQKSEKKKKINLRGWLLKDDILVLRYIRALTATSTIKSIKTPLLKQTDHVCCKSSLDYNSCSTKCKDFQPGTLLNKLRNDTFFLYIYHQFMDR